MKKKRVLAMLLAISLIIPNAYVRADNPNDGTPGDATVISSEEIDTYDSDANDEATEEVTEDVSTEEVANEEVTTEEVTTEEENEEPKKSSFTAPVDRVDTTGIDFSSRELLVGTDDPSIFTWDTEVVSEYNGIYLTRYESEEVTKNAYTYYYGKADFVDVNVEFSVQDNEETEGADLTNLNDGDDALSNLNDMDPETVPARTIAVIDTGINASDLVGSVSVLGGDVSDDNGHGTRMYEYIKDEYPNAKILSIKAMGSDGKGQISDVYAAIQYAIESKVDIINLSISAYSVAGSDVIENVINDAVSQGIIVVGAAGNNGKNAKYFIPGGIDSAIIVGSCDENGTKLSDSNYGATVDYNVSSDSTSEAAARMSGIIASNDGKSKAAVFTPNYSADDETSGTVSYDNGEFIIARNAPGNFESHNTEAYVKAKGLPGYGQQHTYDYYDSDGHKFDSGYDPYGSNALCIDSDSNSGLSDFEFDVPNPTISTDAELTRVLYYAVHNFPYGAAHAIVCYFLQTERGRNATNSYGGGATVYNNDGDIVTLSEAVAAGKATTIPSNKSFKAIILETDTVPGDSGAYQSYISWREEDSLDYYIAIKKIDARGYVMNGVSFTVSYHNNDTNSDVTIKGEYKDGKYYGIWTGFMNNEAKQVPKNYLETANEGVGVFYLGKFSNTPTNISVTENWRGRLDAGSAWAGGRAELVTQLKTETQAKKSHYVYSYEYAPNTSSKTLVAYNTEAEAISSAQADAASEEPKKLYKNWHYAYATMVKKPDNETFAKNNPQYTFDGITYGLYGNSSCTELIATVKLTSNGAKTEGYIKNLTDITINKTTTDNGSEPYRTTINGVHGIGGLMYGNYWWKEISTNNTGYKLDTTPHQITVSASHTEDYYKFTDTDSMEMGKIRVRKLLTGNGASGTSPAGATYRIWSTTFEWESTFTIGADGYSPYKDLVYGTYKIQETGVPTAKPANGTWTIDPKIYTVVLKKDGGTDTVNSEVHVESENATVESTDKAVLNYYVAVKKVDNNNKPMNGITFDITINGIKHTKALITGQYYNGTSYSTTDVPNGVAIYFIGSYEETPPSVSITENWTETWNKQRFYHDSTTRSTAAGTLTLYNTKADAQSHAASFLYKNYSYGFATMHKDPAITTNLSLEGIQYQLKRYRNGNGTVVDQLVATVTLNASGKISNVVLSDMNCWTETLNGEICIGGLTYGDQSGTNNYYWVESQSNTNYYPNTTKHYITVNQANATKPGTDESKYPSVYTFTPASATGTDSPRTYLYLTKASSNPDCTDGNPNYSLEGATYKLYKSRAEAETALTSKNYGTALATFNVKANGTSVVNGTTTVNLDVSKWMDKNTATGLFRNTEFFIIESASGKNYLKSKDVTRVLVTTANTSDNPAHAEMTDKPVNDPFQITLIKTDLITGSNVLPDGKTLEGAEFKVDFYAADIETVLANANGDIVGYLKNHYIPDEDYSFDVTVSKDDEGIYFANLRRNTPFPLGFLVITETQPPTDYTDADSEQFIVDTVNNTTIDVTGKLAFVTYRQFSDDQTSFTEKTYYPNNATTLAELTSATGTRHGVDITNGAGVTSNYIIKVGNQPIRGDVKLTKVTYANGTPLESVEFVIKNLDTGEEHSIFTDAQGNATTVGNEDAWFSKSTDDNDPIPYTAGYGALPAGNYTITEKRGETNEKYQLLASEPFTIDSESTILIAASDNKLYNIEMPYLTTIAMDEATQSKSVAQGETATIIDTIKYYHLRANSKFFIVGTLMVRHQDGTYEPYMKDGEPYTVTSEAINTPATWTKSEFEIDGEYVMEFPDVNPAGYEGCSFVVFQKLYYDAVPSKDSIAKQYKEYAGTTEKIFPVLHEDIDEEGQTVRPVDIHTNATDGITGDHISKPEGTVTIVDRVSYTGLTVGEEYTITGTLHVTGYTWKDAKGNEIKTVDADDTLLDEEGQPVTAETTFTAESKDGFVDLEFTVDASLLAGESVVAFESLIYKDREIAIHADLSDEDETVHFPMIHTTLYREGTGEWAEDYDDTDPTKVTTVDEASKEVMAADNAVVVDRIKYHNLIAGRSYVVKGILVDKATGEPLLDANGEKIEVEQKFTLDEVPEENITVSPDAGDYILADGTILDMSADHSIRLVDGYFEVTFPAFDASEMGNKTAVAFEEVYLLSTDANGDETEHLLAEHKDKDDVDQTVRFVEIHTNATVEETNTKMVPLEGPVTINDKVSYKNLIPGMEYSLTATPVVKGDVTGTYEDGDQLLDKNGKPVTATITFKPEKPDGEIVVPITFEGYLIPEIEIVCYETMTNYKGLDIAIHDNIDDKDQTVIVVKVSTTAKDSVTEDNESLATEETVIIDTVSYEGLEKGLTYRIVGTIMQRSTEKPVLDAEGNEITAEVEFVAEQSEGTIDITFPAFDSVGLALAGDSVVVFEKIYLVKEKKDDTDEDAGEDTTDILIGHHEDINDEGQTVNIPEIHTTAYDSETEDHVGTVGEKITIVDVVTYKNLKTEEYTVKGVLMDKETGKELLVDGKPVTAEKTFTPEKPDGTVELEFTLDSTALAGTSTIVFENIYRNGKLAGVHNSLEDKDQEIDFPKVRTKAEDAVTKQDIGKTSTTTTIIDTVFYTNLHVGDNKEYTVKGVLMDRDTGKELLVDGKPVTAEKTFIPEKPDGTIELEFTFDGSALNGEVIVVFEDLYRNKKLVYSHGSLTDTEQTVYYPSVHTHVEDQTKRVQPVENVTVVDDVMYSKLKIGERYQLVGVLVDKKTGKNIVVDNTPIKATKVFTAETEDGMITMEFHFDATGLEGDVTVFEYLSLVKDVDNKDLNYYLVAEHTDLNDTEQTFVISPVPKTGDTTPIKMVFGLLLLSGLGLAYIFWKKKNMISR